jgi:CubicO group peptidase (beta-lactamase class C family)
MPHSLLLALGFALAQDTTQPPSFTALALHAADSIAAAEFAKDSLGSITVGIVSGPSLVWTKSYGYADSARTRLATPTTVYRIASVSKQFTAVMLLQLVERGKVSLSDPVDRFFPEIRSIRGRTQGSALVTIVQLATMTSGIARDPKDERASQRGRPQTWMTTLVAALPKTEFVRPPGVGYGYSNVGYAILAAALSRASGESYTSYLQRHIIQPLGMTSTAFELTPGLTERLAIGVDYDELVVGKLNYGDAAGDHRLGLGISTPSGGIYSTVGDVAKFVSLELAFGPRDVLSQASLDLRDNVAVASTPTLGYGYGLGSQVMRWADTVAVGHSGNLAGYTSMVLYDRKRKFSVIVLRSAAGGEADAGRLAGRVFRRLFRDASM